jgi:hypothetical protein
MRSGSRHHIIGSEAHLQRPPAYMQRGRTRRVSRRRRGPLIPILLGLAALLVCAWVAAELLLVDGGLSLG